MLSIFKKFIFWRNNGGFKRYERHVGDVIINEQQKLITENRKILSGNGIPLNKIRFIFLPIFTYDMDNNIVNPSYETLLPIKDNGLIDKKSPIIEIGKPENLIVACVEDFKIDDVFNFIKYHAVKSKKGIVILIGDNYQIGDNIIRMTNLDDLM